MNSSDKFVVWTSAPVPHAFVLHKLSGVELHFQLVKGVPRLEGFPTDATHSVDPDYPNEIVTMDAFRSPHLITLISSALKDFLVNKSIIELEFLPVTIINHKNNPVGDYFILHPVHPIDCMDIQASEAKPHVAVPKNIGEIKRIVLLDDRVELDRQVFKIKGLYREIIVSKALAEEIDAAGFTGVSWTNLRDYSHN